MHSSASSFRICVYFIFSCHIFIFIEFVVTHIKKNESCSTMSLSILLITNERQDSNDVIGGDDDDDVTRICIKHKIEWSYRNKNVYIYVHSTSIKNYVCVCTSVWYVYIINRYTMTSNITWHVQYKLILHIEITTI